MFSPFCVILFAMLFICRSLTRRQHNITNNIKELEFKLEKGLEIEANLNSQIQSYIEQERLNQLLVDDYKKQLEFKEEIIDLVKPKWYDNKYLWFFGGIIITSGSVYLAGQIK